MGLAGQGAQISITSDTTRADAKGSGPAADWPGRILHASHRLLQNDTFVFGLPAALLVFGLIGQLNTMLVPDVGWYLHSGERYLDGGELYRDIFVEVNPPFGFFLTLPAVILSRFTGLASVDLFVIYVYLLIALSLAAVWWLLRRDAQMTPVLRRGLLVLAAIVLVVGPGGQFGQREHFLVLLSLPYLLLTARRAAGSGVPWLAAFGIGLTAGLGFGLKPHFLLVPLALEAYRLALTRRPLGIMRAENLGVGVTLLGYALVVVVVTPDYLTRIVPYALEVYNQAYRNTVWVNLIRGHTVMLPVGCLLHLGMRRAQKVPQLGDVFFIASTCLFLAYLAQMKGWDYHLIPATAALVLGYGMFFLNRLEPTAKGAGEASHPRSSREVAVASLILILLLLGSATAKLGYSSPFTQIMSPYVDRYARGGSIAIFGSNVWPGFPMINYKKLGWSSRFPTLWLLPGTIRKRHAGAGTNRALLDEMEGLTRDSVIADFTADMPDLVIIDDRDEKPYFGDVPFDYLDFFREDPRFERIWSEYVWVVEEVHFDIYRRRCAPNCRQAVEP